MQKNTANMISDWDPVETTSKNLLIILFIENEKVLIRCKSQVT